MTAGWIALKFGLWADTHYIGILEKLIGSTGARAHPLFRISRTAGQISLKFGVWLEDHLLCVFQRMGDIRTSARVTMHTFKHICLLPPVHRPKGVILVIKIEGDVFILLMVRFHVPVVIIFVMFCRR